MQIGWPSSRKSSLLMDAFAEEVCFVMFGLVCFDWLVNFCIGSRFLMSRACSNLRNSVCRPLFILVFHFTKTMSTLRVRLSYGAHLY